MSRILFLILASCLLAGCRSSKTASSSMEQNLTSSVAQASDSVGLSLSRQLQRMLGEGTLSARIIRFYPSADSLPPVIIPSQPLPASAESPLPSGSHYQPEAPSPHSRPMPWLLPFGQISSITDITFHGTTLRESGSSQLNASASSDSIRGNLSFDETASHSSIREPDRMPWYKQVIIFLFAVMCYGVVTLLFYRSESNRFKQS
ncbi:MAG: hypothetical protein IJV42_01700 [Bacteroidaceae bacterium]|nr:hypothetical protein [Bacteroidaceae bacterium]